jgi:hypothetical protein
MRSPMVSRPLRPFSVLKRSSRARFKKSNGRIMNRVSWNHSAGLLELWKSNNVNTNPSSCNPEHTKEREEQIDNLIYS